MLITRGLGISGETSNEQIELKLSNKNSLILPCDTERVYVNTVGLNLVWSIGQDISTADDLKILVKRPDKTTTSWIPELASFQGITDRLLFTTISGSLAQTGVYEFQPQITINGKILFGLTSQLTVHKQFT